MSGQPAFAAAHYQLTLLDGASVVIAPLAPADGQRLGTIFAGIDPWAAYGYPAAALSAFLSTAEPGTHRFALQLADDMVGAAVIRPGWLRGPYLQFLGVVPGFQRRGFGGALLAWMEREARAAKERNLWVAASEINTDAIRLYERHGFTQTTKLDDLAWDGRAEILMRKRL